MGKIYELFGELDKQDVIGLPNDVLKKSIASGNYGQEKIRPNTGPIDMDNPMVKYLFNANNEKNINYWYNEILSSGLTWRDMWAYFKEIGLARRTGFHPYDYGFKWFDCPPGMGCDVCHRKTLKLLYQLYKSKL